MTRPQPTRYELVLLDLDGTLTDSAPGILASVRHAYAALGLPVPAEPVLRGFVGPPLAESFLAHGVPAGLVGDAVAAYREVYAAGNLLDNAVYPGVPECLTAVRASGARLAVATSKPEPMARRIVEHFGLDAFLDRGPDDVFGATLDGTRTSKGDVIAHALASFDGGGLDATGLARAGGVVMVVTASTTCSAPPCTASPVSVSRGAMRTPASCSRPGRAPSSVHLASSSRRSSTGPRPPDRRTRTPSHHPV